MTVHLEYNFPLDTGTTPLTWDNTGAGAYVWCYIDIAAGTTDLSVQFTSGDNASQWYSYGVKPVPGDDITFGDPAPTPGDYLPTTGLGQNTLTDPAPPAGRLWLYMNGSHSDHVSVDVTMVAPQAIWTDLVGCVEH